MNKNIDQSWRDWIALNLSRNCDKSEVIQILFDHQFDPIAIIEELNQYPDAQNLIGIVIQKTKSSGFNQINHIQSYAIKGSQNALSIDFIKLPFAQKANTHKANFFVIENFLDPNECLQLIALIKSQCKPSTITNPNEPDKAFRTSQTCDLGLLDNHPLVNEIDNRISEYMGIELDRSETIQGQYYQVGQQFKTHTDYFEPNSAEYTKFAGEMGQRTWTFMIYLNAVDHGGETNFPILGIEQRPKIGKAVVWNSLMSNGDVNPATAHCANPVLAGEKFVITKWFRTHGKLIEDYIIPPRKKLPIFTRNGFFKLAIPNDLFVSLKAFYDDRKCLEVPEDSDAIGTFIKSASKLSPATMIELNDTMRAMIFKSITPLLEEWAGRRLEPSTIYGIREYKNGAALTMHVDRIETHQVSAILNVAQSVKTDWPLQIHDHMGKLHQVVMKPGEMLFYESARLPHGRTLPLDGEYFANIFTHTKPL